ncbi:MAG: STT3 domain-containing protein [Archaeoglobaceae archaeon]
MDKKVLLLLVLLFAFVLRMQNFAEVFDSQIYYYEYDPYYHMRLVEVIVEKGSRPNYDYYLNYPYGMRVDWLPLFDYILAVPGVIFGFQSSEIFAVFLPVILGVLSVFLIYLISLELVKNQKFALFSAFIYTVIPISVWRSILGFPDHHSWVVFLLLLSFYLLLKPGFWKILSGIPMLLMAFSWLGTPIYAAILAISALLSFKERELRLIAISNAIPLFSFIQQPYIAFSFLILALFLFLGSFVKSYETKIKNATIYYTLSSLFCVLLVYFLPIRTFDFLRAGINYIFGVDIYLPTISEAGQFQILDLIGSAGHIFFILAFISIFLFKNRFLISIFILSLFLSLMQVRFTEILAIPVAFLSAYTFCIILDRVEYPIFEKVEEKKRRKEKFKKKKEKKEKEIVSTKDHLVVAVFICILAIPCISMAIVPFELTRDWKEALTWMKENLENQDYLNPYEKPEYAILSWWDYGNWILYLSKKAVVCNNFQAGAEDAAKFFVAESEEEAMKLIEKRGVKYLITVDELTVRENKKTKFSAVMQIAGLNPSLMTNKEIEEYFNKTILYKLHVENAKNLTHFRLLRDFGSVKIFEVLN